jgi:hypothetical protein
VAGKKQAPLEKLRAQAPQHAANDGSCVCIPVAEKILNRLFRVTPHFFEPDTLVSFGLMLQSNVKIYSKK